MIGNPILVDKLNKMRYSFKSIRYHIVKYTQQLTHNISKVKRSRVLKAPAAIPKGY